MAKKYGIAKIITLILISGCLGISSAQNSDSLQKRWAVTAYGTWSNSATRQYKSVRWETTHFRYHTRVASSLSSGLSVNANLSKNIGVSINVGLSQYEWVMGFARLGYDGIENHEVTHYVDIEEKSRSADYGATLSFRIRFDSSEPHSHTRLLLGAQATRPLQRDYILQVTTQEPWDHSIYYNQDIYLLGTPTWFYSGLRFEHYLGDFIVRHEYVLGPSFADLQLFQRQETLAFNIWQFRAGFSLGYQF